MNKYVTICTSDSGRYVLESKRSARSARYARERTCLVVEDATIEDSMGTQRQVELSCGHVVIDTEPSFCPCCGARVVGAR